MADLDSVVAGAISEAGVGGDAGGGESTIPDATPEPISTPDPSPTPPAPGETPATPAPVVDPLEAELAALASGPVKGRDNRVPHSRVQQLVNRAVEKAKAEQAKALEETNGKLTAAQQRAQLLDNLERLAEQDPDGYIRYLAKARPDVYQKYLQTQAPAAPAKPAGDDDPRPSPDGVHADGTPGYTQEGWEAVAEWKARQLIKASEAKHEKEFGPIVKEWQANKVYQQQGAEAQKVRAALDQTWGADFIKKHEKEIVTAMQADMEQARLTRQPQTPIELLISRVLVPKIREEGTSNLTSMRQQVLKEMKTRPAAAEPNPASPAAPKTGPQSIEDTIREAIRGAGL